MFYIQHQCFNSKIIELTIYTLQEYGYQIEKKKVDSYKSLIKDIYNLTNNPNVDLKCLN